MPLSAPPDRQPNESDETWALRLRNYQLEQEIEKLRLELADLESAASVGRRVWTGFLAFLPIVSTVLAIAGFWFGIIQYFNGERQKQADRIDELKREAAQALWQKQLDLYIDASTQAAVVANSSDDAARTTAEQRFWVLYWGPLAAVEDVSVPAADPAAAPTPAAKVEAAMVGFARLLHTKPAERDRRKMRLQSLQLAHAVRESIRPTFNVTATASQVPADQRPGLDTPPAIADEGKSKPGKKDG